MKKLMKNRKGFTLIELIVVIAILGILAAILIPQFTGFQDRAKMKESIAEARNMLVGVQALLAEGETASNINQAMIETITGADYKGTMGAVSTNAKGEPTFDYTSGVDAKYNVKVIDGKLPS